MRVLDEQQHTVTKHDCMSGWDTCVHGRRVFSSWSFEQMTGERRGLTFSPPKSPLPPDPPVPFPRMCSSRSVRGPFSQIEAGTTPVDILSDAIDRRGGGGWGRKSRDGWGGVFRFHPFARRFFGGCLSLSKRVSYLYYKYMQRCTVHLLPRGSSGSPVVVCAWRERIHN